MVEKEGKKVKKVYEKFDDYLQKMLKEAKKTDLSIVLAVQRPKSYPLPVVLLNENMSIEDLLFFNVVLESIVNLFKMNLTANIDVKGLKKIKEKLEETTKELDKLSLNYIG